MRVRVQDEAHGGGRSAEQSSQFPGGPGLQGAAGPVFHVSGSGSPLREPAFLVLTALAGGNAAVPLAASYLPRHPQA